MEHELVLRAIVAVIVLSIILVPTSQLFGEDRLAETTKRNLTPEFTISITDNNAKVDVRPLEDGYLYEISASPGLDIQTNSVADAFVIFTFKDQSVRAKVIGKEGQETDTFKAEYGATRYKFTAEITSFIPPLAEWNRRPLEDNIPVIVKSSDNKPVIVVGRTKLVLDDSGIDMTPFQTCKADVRVSCPGDLQYTSYLKLCGPDDPVSVCEEILEVCGGTMEITIVDEGPDCSNRKVPVNMFYRDGKAWEPGEKIGVSFWNAKCGERTQTSDYRQLLVLCAEYRMGDNVLDAGLLQG